MTINSAANKTIANGNGSQTQFGFSFVGVAAAYIAVILTDADGNETPLTQGSGATQYQITLNAPVPGALWGLGGTVTYDPSGTPLPNGSTLTIFRTLPLTQAISLQNQISLSSLGDGAETGLDTLEMQIQQIAEQYGRAIVAPIVDPSTIDLTLPSAAQRANTGLAFDSQGNVIAGTLPASGVISTAMQPVVNAASLAAGRAAFGLGAMAVEGIGAGLQDDGAGNARVIILPMSDATNQTVTAAFHLTQRIATGPIAYTLPRANTVFPGFGFWIYAITGNVAITPNANDNFPGLAGGLSIAVPQGSWVYISTDGASSGTWWANFNGENISLAAAVSGNALTITLNATSLKLRDPTLANGDPKWAYVPANLAIAVPAGATLGTTNTTPFRLWLFGAYHGGSPVLGVALGSNLTQIFPLSAWETEQNSASQISAASGSAGTLYTSVAIAGDSVRILGYVEFAAGQTTAGQWVSAPSTLQIMGPGIKRPGDVVQTRTGVASGAPTVGLTPTSLSNPFRISATGSAQLGTTGSIGSFNITRNGAIEGLGQSAGATSVSFSTVMPISLDIIDRPGVSPVGYSATTSVGTLQNVTITVDELMG